jgi:hypothetical protein
MAADDGPHLHLQPLGGAHDGSNAVLFERREPGRGRGNAGMRRRNDFIGDFPEHRRQPSRFGLYPMRPGADRWRRREALDVPDRPAAVDPQSPLVRLAACRRSSAVPTASPARCPKPKPTGSGSNAKIGCSTRSRRSSWLSEPRPSLRESGVHGALEIIEQRE